MRARPFLELSAAEIEEALRCLIKSSEDAIRLFGVEDPKEEGIHAYLKRETMTQAINTGQFSEAEVLGEVARALDDPSDYPRDEKLLSEFISSMMGAVADILTAKTPLHFSFTVFDLVWCMAKQQAERDGVEESWSAVMQDWLIGRSTTVLSEEGLPFRFGLGGLGLSGPSKN